MIRGNMAQSLAAYGVAIIGSFAIGVGFVYLSWYGGPANEKHSKSDLSSMNQVVDDEMPIFNLTPNDAADKANEIYAARQSFECMKSTAKSLIRQTDSAYMEKSEALLQKASEDKSENMKNKIADAELFLGVKYFQKHNARKGFEWIAKSGAKADTALELYLAVQAQH
ncbi:MAG TPA: hypothetical protein VHQ41_01615 [Patescibacteria group bacterium]|nr:hypothetical protein [Patescibacteria group bacterium]